jgi:hypothetical protein
MAKCGTNISDGGNISGTLTDSLTISNIVGQCRRPHFGGDEPVSSATHHERSVTDRDRGSRSAMMVC